jgi:uncharacterized protein (TIGR02145 family)
MSITDQPIGLALTDKTTGQPLIYLGETSSLSVALANNSGADIALNAADPAKGIPPATFSFYPPRGFFTKPGLSAFTLSQAGWSGSVDPSNPAFDIVCTQDATWKNGTTLTFKLTNVTPSGSLSPSTGKATVEPENMGDLPPGLFASLSAANPPQPGNLSLADVLQLQLDGQGTVYRSVAGDPLTNKLFLTIKNAGAAPLATEKNQQPGTPQVSVTFVYGSTSGSLAPDGYDPNTGPPTGSAWNIKVDVQSIQAPWGGINPKWSTNLPDPSWLLVPASNNYSILGPAQSDGANVTFSFSPVVSQTPIGHTQMLVLFSGFAKDATTKYNDHLFVLDIAKVDPPPTRGLISFAGVEPLIAVSEPDQKVSVDLRWGMFDVASVQLFTSVPGIAPRTKPYLSPQPLAYDTDKIVLPTLQTSQAFFTTLQAFDGNGGYLNSLQFTTYAQLSYVIDPHHKVYRIALVGDTFWLVANYDYDDDGEGIYFYDGDPSYETPYGRLYDLDAAMANPPADGWELPTAADWQALFAAYSKGSVPTYTQLMAGGSSGFNAQLGGWRTPNPDGSGSYSNGPYTAFPNGFYWAADSGQGLAGVQFSGSSQQIAVIPVSDRKTAMSVRYVRHA